ncbi:MAG: methylenetetrahydrofolate--tRNA-(uracil(54)-C(5))-methyltransferase (FADH(2)-oxidizing) TrmFO, partial [Nitrospinota bacterium]
MSESYAKSTMVETGRLSVIGGGLAGCEAAWQAANQGVLVTLFEMRPDRKTPAHKTSYLAEILCSNSLRSNAPENPHGTLKEELRRLGSLLLRCADENALPAGKALAVDREKFARVVTERVENHPNISVVRKEITSLPETTSIVASGPLTADTLAKHIEEFFGASNLYFYDALSPVVDADSIDYNKAFFASRFEKGGTDYLNLPFSEVEYSRFYDALMEGERTGFREFEEPRFFPGCMPVEVIAESGKESLLFGPMRPKGIFHPETGKRPFAVVQLRREEEEGKMYNIVGFQTRLKHGSQKKVLRLIPGLENVEVLRYGGMHRNTFINSPHLLLRTLECKTREALYFAGQITGVEGYVESIATGLIA